MAHAHVLQHVAFEGPGTIAAWLERAGYQVTITRLDLGDALPENAALDLLVVMGGPMSVHDTGRHPWLAAELAFVGRCLADGTPMLGICLGAQIIAAAAGAGVYRNAEPEIGWFPIQAVQIPSGVDVFRFPSTAQVFHWHGETFDLPPRAIHLASSDVCRHQAFQLGRSVLGLQFHIETTAELVDGLVANGASDLVASPHVQPAADLLAHDPARYAALEPLVDAVLTFLGTARVAVP